MSLEEQFNQAAESVRKFTKRPNDTELLHLYALYKQATVGDNNTAKSGMLDLKGKAKWEAWNGQKGQSKEASMQAYIALVETQQRKYA